MKRFKNKAMPFDAAWVVQRDFSETTPGRIAFCIGGRVVECGDGMTEEEARRHVVDQLSENLLSAEQDLHAKIGCADLRSAMQAISQARNWPDVHALAMAYRFAIPTLLPLLHIRFSEPTYAGIGRGHDVGRSNVAMTKMAHAWQELTGTKASLAEGSAFLSTAAAAAPYFGLHLGDLRSAFENRVRKMEEKRVVMHHRPGGGCGQLPSRKQLSTTGWRLSTENDLLRG